MPQFPESPVCSCGKPAVVYLHGEPRCVKCAIAQLRAETLDKVKP